MAQQCESRTSLFTVNGDRVWTTYKDNLQGKATLWGGLAPALAQAHSQPESGWKPFGYKYLQTAESNNEINKRISE